MLMQHITKTMELYVTLLLHEEVEHVCGHLMVKNLQLLLSFRNIEYYTISSIQKSHLQNDVSAIDTFLIK